jgi:hypothetical protein
MTKIEAATFLVEMVCTLANDYKSTPEYHEAVAIACAALIGEPKEVEG